MVLKAAFWGVFICALLYLFLTACIFAYAGFVNEYSEVIEMLQLARTFVLFVFACCFMFSAVGILVAVPFIMAIGRR